MQVVIKSSIFSRSVQNKLAALTFALISSVGLFAFVGLDVATAPVAKAAAGINQQINFQGRLLNSQGATVPDGTYNIQFKIYQDGDGTVAGDTSGTPAGTLLWTESYANNSGGGITVKNGYFSVLLGSKTSLSSVNFNSDTLWLSLNIGGSGASPSYDGEMLPMKRFAANPYALNSNALGGFTSSQFLQLGTGNLQADASTNTTLQLNKTSSTGNILDLQRGGQDVALINNTGSVLFQNTTNSVTALNVKNAAGASVFDVDTTNQRIGINNNAPAYAVDAVGDINASVSLKVGGTTVCTATGCSVASGSGSYIQNQSATAQSANYNIQSASASTVGAVIKGAASQSADLFQLQDSNGIVVTKLNAGGTLTLGNVTSTGTAYAGKIVVGDGSTDNYALTVQSRTLTANQTVYLPNASGTICLSTGNCPAAGGSGNYIQTQYSTAQPAEFFIQSDIIDGVPTGAATGVIQAASSQTGDLLQFQTTSGNVTSGFNTAGNLYYQSGSYAATLNTSTLTANRTISLPDASGTLLTNTSANGLYIQNQVLTAQAANFYVQGLSGNVTATLKGEATGTADILDLYNGSGGKSASFNSGGSLTIGATQITGTRLSVIGSGTATVELGLKTYAGQTADIQQNQDANGNIYSGITATGGVYSNGTNNVFSGLAYPTGIVGFTGGTTGSTSYYYRVSALNSQGETIASPEFAVTNGNATLSATNYVGITWNAVPGATSYNVYGRTTGAELLMFSRASNGSATYNFTDTGSVTPSGALPTGAAFTNPTLSLTGSASTGSQKILNISSGIGGSQLYVNNFGQTISTGNFIINNANDANGALQLRNSYVNTSSVNATLQIQSTTGQTADLVQYQSVNGGVTSGINSLGGIYSNGTANTFGGLTTPVATTANPGTAYYFVVTAGNAAGTQTLPSAEVAGANPSNITWAPIPGATLYYVYRGTAAGAENVYTGVSPSSCSATLCTISSNATYGNSGTPPATTTGATFTVQGWTGQTNNLFSVLTSSGSSALSVTSQSNVVIGNGEFVSGAAQANITGLPRATIVAKMSTTLTTNDKGILIQETANNTSNTFELQDASANVLTNIDTYGYLHINRAVAATDAIFTGRVAGDTFDRSQILANGQINFGSGSAAVDTSIQRTNPGILQVNGSLVVAATNTGVNVLVAQGPATGLTGDLFEARLGGTVVARFNNTGQLVLGLLNGTGYAGQASFADGTGDGFASLLNTTTLTANRTISLPNASGTVCLDSSVNNCSYALASGSGNYIQNQSTGTQAANFNIQGIANSVTATLQAGTGTGDIVDFNNSAGTKVAYIASSGTFKTAVSIYAGNFLTGANGNNTAFGVSTGSASNVAAVFKGVASQTADLQENIDVNSNILSGFTANGALYTNGTANTLRGLSYPSNVTATAVGTTGSTVYSYHVSAVNAAGAESNAAPLATNNIETNGNATLSATNYNTVAWGSVAGASSYRVYGRTGGTEQFITTVTSNGAATYSFNDTGTITPSGTSYNFANQQVGSTTNVTLTLSGAADLSSNILYATGRGTSNFYIDSSAIPHAGSIVLNNAAAGVTTPLISAVNGTATTVAAYIQAATSQSADLLQYRDNSGVTMSGVNNLGGLYGYGTSNSFIGLGAPTITTASTGSAYYYAVASYNLSSVGAAGNIVGMANNTSTITWNAVPGVRGYQVFRSTASDFSANVVVLGTTGSTNFTDNGITGTTTVLPVAPVGSTFTIQGWSSQTADVFSATASGGSTGLRVLGGGQVYVGTNLGVGLATTGTGVGKLSVQAGSTTGITQVNRLLLGQTSDLFELQDSSANVITNFDANGYLHINRAISANDTVITDQVTGDTNNRFELRGNGTLGFGSGSSAVDVTLSRTAPSSLTVSGSFKATTTLTVGNLYANPSNYKLYVQPGSTTTLGEVITAFSGQSSDLFQLQTSAGAATTGFNSAGNLYYQSGSFANVLNTSTLTANRTISLPDASGTICLDSSVNNCNYALASSSGNYIQNSTALQTANFNIQSASTTSVAASIQAASGNTVDILDVYTGTGSKTFSVNSLGNVGILQTLAVGQGVTNQSMLDVFAVSPVNKVVTIRAAASQVGDLSENQDVNRNILSSFNNVGALTTNGTANVFSGLVYPATVTVAPQGTTGSTTYAYRVSALNSQGETLASPEITTTSGNATLSATNYNLVSWTPVAGATTYKVYGRTTGAELLMTTITGNGQAANYTFSDTGTVTPSGALPSGSGFSPVLTINGQAGGSSALSVKTFSGASAFVVNGSSGFTNANASLTVSNVNANNYSALQVLNALGTTVASFIQGASSQSADLLQNRDANGSVLSGINANGQTYSNGTGETIGNLSVPTGVASNTTGTAFYYKVTAFNGTGETIGSSEVSGSSAATTISWTQVAGAVGYRVYRGTAAGAETGYFQVSNGTTTSLTNAQAASLTTASIPTSTVGSGLTIQGWAGQTSTAITVKNASNGLIYAVGVNGIAVGPGIANINGTNNAYVATTNTGTVISSALATNVALTLQNTNASSTADLLDVQSSTGTVLAKVDANGNLTAPTLTSTGNTIVGGSFNQTNSAVSNYLLGALGLGTTSPQAGSALTLANDTYISSVDASGTGYINLFKVNTNNEIQAGAAINVDGGILLPTDGGQIALIDQNLTSASAAGTASGYTFGVGNTNVLTVYAESDGNGSAQNQRVAIGSSIQPAYTLDVGGDINSSTNVRTAGTIRLTNTGNLQNIGTIGASGLATVGALTTTGAANVGLLIASGTANVGSLTTNGGLTLVSGSFGSAVNTASLTANRTITLPDASGTVCLDQSVNNCGYATSSSGNFIQNQSASTQTGNFNIQSASASSVGAVIQGASGQTADLLDLRSSAGINLTGVDTNGSINSNGTQSTLSALQAPTLTGTYTGTAGATQYRYYVTAVNNLNEVASAQLVIGSAATSLSASNYMSLSWNAVAGATSYRIYGRTNGSQTLMTTVAASSASSTYSLVDNGTLTPNGSTTVPTQSSTPVLTLNGTGGSGASGGSLAVFQVNSNTATASNYALLSIQTPGTNGTRSTAAVQGGLSINNNYLQGSTPLSVSNYGSSPTASFNSVSTGDILRLSGASGTGATGFNNAAALYFTNNTFTSTINTGALTANRTINLPDASGTVCLDSSVNNCSYAASTGAAGYIQNATSVQTANFNITSASAASVAAIITGATGQGTDILRVVSPTGGAVVVTKGGTLTATAGVSFNNSNLGSGTSATISTVNASGTALVVQGVTGQTAQLIKIGTNGNVLSGFDSNASLFFASGSFNTTLNTTTLTANRTVNLPDASGTVCLDSSVNNCNYALATGSSGYIQNGTSVQTANFNIQSAAIGSVAGTITAAVGQTADIFQVIGTGSGLFRVSKTGSISDTVGASFSNGNNNGQASLSVSTALGTTIAANIIGASGQTADLLDYTDVNKNVLSRVDANGSLVTNGTANSFLGLNYPSTVSLTTGGTAGSTTYAYRVSSVNSQGETTASPEVTIATGNATLSATNYVGVSWTPVAGALQYKVYGRTASGELLITTITGDGRTTNYSYQDSGSITPSGSLPSGASFAPSLTVGSTNTTGTSNSFSALTASGQVGVSISNTGTLRTGASIVATNQFNGGAPAIKITDTNGGSTYNAVGLQIQGTANQTGDLLQNTDANSSVLSGVNAQGGFYSNGTGEVIGNLGVPTNVASSTTGTAFYYKVTAYNGVGETIGSSEVSGSSSATTISWTAVAGANGYRIYRGTTAGAETGYAQVSNGLTTSLANAQSATLTTAVIPTSVTGSGLVIQTWSGQTVAGITASPFTIKNSAGSVLSYFNVNNNYYYAQGIANVNGVANSAVNTSNTGTIISTGNISNAALTLQNTAASSTGNLLQFQNSSGTILSSFNSNGQLTLGNSASTQAGSLSVADGTNDGYLATLALSGALQGNTNFTLPGTLTAGTYQICTSGGNCPGVTGNYVNNSTTQQTGNFNLQSASATSVGGVIQGATGQTADYFDILNSGGSQVFAVTTGASSQVKISSSLNIGNGTSGSANLVVHSTGVSNNVVQIQSLGSTQVGDLLDLQSSSLATLTKFDANGNFTSYGTSTQLIGLATPTGVSSSVAGTTNYYKVSAMNAQGETSASAEVSGGAATTISWNAVNGATSYRVYRGTAAAGENVYITVTAPIVSLANADTATTSGSAAPSINSTNATGNFVIQGWGGQNATGGTVANLLDIKNSGGSSLVNVSKYGNLNANVGITVSGPQTCTGGVTASLCVRASSGAGLDILAQAGATDLLDLRNTAGTLLSSFDNNGNLSLQPANVVAAAATNGTNAANVLNVTGSAGGATTGTTGQTAGNGAGISLTGGTGGSASSGSTNGNGGSVTIQGGAGGSGTGSAGSIGTVSLQANGGSVAIGATNANSKLLVTYDPTVSGVFSSAVTFDAANSSASTYSLVLRSKTGTGTASNKFAVQGNGYVAVNQGTAAYPLDVNGNVNTNSSYLVNGTDINAGGLTNVAYLNQANTFTAAQSIQSASGVALTTTGAAGQDIADFYTTGGTFKAVAIDSGGRINGNSGATLSVSSAASNTTVIGTATNTNTTGTGTVTTNAFGVNLNSSNNTAGGSNVLNGINFNNVTARTGSSYNGLYVGSGYTSILNYNGTSLISGLGKLQNAAIDSSANYSNLQNVTNLTATGTLTGTALYQGTNQVCDTSNNCNYLTTSSASTNYIQNGTTQQASSNFNISGTGTAAILNATSSIQLNGTDINTAGALSNVAYQNQSNQFTKSQSVVGDAGVAFAVNAASGAQFIASFNNSVGTPVTTFGADGSINTAGTISTNGSARIDANGNLTNIGNISTANSFTQSLSRTLPTTVGTEVDLGSYILTYGAGSFTGSITVASNTFSVAKSYNFNIAYNQTSNTWVAIQPISNTGNYAVNDFSLEANVNSGTLQLRIRRTLGTQGGVAYVVLEHDGVASDGFVPSTATSAVSAPTTSLSSAVLSQTGGNATIQGGLIVAPSSGVAALFQGAGASDIADFNNAVGTQVAKIDSAGNLNAASISTSGTQRIDAAGNVTAAQANFTLSSGTSANTVNITGSNVNTSSTTSTINGLNVGVFGTANSNAGGNVTNAINFANATAATNNTYNGLYFGTGYSSILNYNGASLVNGSGLLQNVAFDSAQNYSNLQKVTNLTITGTATVAGLNTPGIVQTNGSGTLSTSTIGRNSTLLTGTLNNANGGTGLDTSAAANGQLLVGNGSGLSLATITQGSGITVTNGSGSISIGVNSTVCTTTNNCSYQTAGNYINNGVSSQANANINIASASGSIAAVIQGASGQDIADFKNSGGSVVAAVDQYGNIGTTGSVLASSVNASTALLLNGANINTSGTLSDVAYLDANQTFTGTNYFNNAIYSPTAYVGSLVQVGSPGNNYGQLSLTTSANTQLATLSSSILTGSGNATFLLPGVAGGSSYTLCTTVTCGANGSYIANGTSQQTGANFNIDGNGTIGGTLGVVGATTVGSLTTTGSVTTGSVTNNGNESIAGTLGVQGTTTLSGNLTENGAANFQNTTNSASAFQIQNATGSNGSNTILNVDTTANAGNLVANGSFEQNITGWTAKSAGSTIALSPNTSNGYYGTDSLQISSTTPALLDGAKYTGLNFVSGQYYVFSFWVKASTATGTFSTVAAGYSYDGTTYTTPSTTITANSTGWGRYAVGFTATTTTSNGVIYIGQNDAVSRTFYVDGVDLETAATSTILSNDFYNDGRITLNGKINSQVILQNSQNSQYSFVVAQANGNPLLYVDTLNGTSNILGTLNVSAATNLSGAITVTNVQTSSITNANAFRVRNSTTLDSTINIDTTTTNLITNPSVENSTTNYAANGTGASVASSAAVAHSGATSLAVTTTTSAVANAGAKYTYALASSTSYTFSFYALNTGAAFNTLVAGRAENGSTNTVCNISNSVVSSLGWNRYSCTFTTGTVSGTTYLFIGQSDAGVAHTYNIDDLQLTSGGSLTPYRDGAIQLNGTITGPATFQNANNSSSAFQVQNASGANLFGVDTTSANIVQNPGMENGIGAWVVDGASSLTPTTVKSLVYDGQGALTVTTPATAATGVKTTAFSTAIASNTTYSLSFYAKGATTFNTLVAGYSNDGSTKTACTLNIASVVTTGYTRFACTFTTGTVSGSPFIYFDQSDATARTFYLDDVQLTATSSAGAFSAGALQLSGVINTPVTLQNNSDSTTAFQIQSSNGTNLLTVDSLNRQILITSNVGITGALYATGAISVGGQGSIDATQYNLQLDSSSTFADSGTCNATTNQGALYYNTNTTSLRGCSNGSWTDVVTVNSLGLIAYGVMPDSGANPGDLVSAATAGTSGPCKVSWLSSTSVSVAACSAYSGGRKVNVAATTITGLTSGTSWYHIYIDPTSGNAIASSAQSTDAAGQPTFSTTAPVVSLADILTNVGGTISNIYDTRTFTTTSKTFVTVNSAGPLGSMVKQSTTSGVATVTIANDASMLGVLITSTGVASTTAPNAIIATGGPAFVKTTGNPAAASVLQASSATNGYAQGGTSTTAYGNIGVAQQTATSTCSTAANCQTSVLLNVLPR